MTAFVGIARFQRTIFVGYRDSFSAQNPVWLVPQARQICGGAVLADGSSPLCGGGNNH